MSGRQCHQVVSPFHFKDSTLYVLEVNCTVMQIEKSQITLAKSNLHKVLELMVALPYSN
jgi:hypothetical protein